MNGEDYLRFVIAQIIYTIGLYGTKVFYTRHIRFMFQDALHNRRRITYQFRHGAYILMNIQYFLRVLYLEKTLVLEQVPKSPKKDMIVFMTHLIGEMFILKIMFIFLLLGTVIELFLFYSNTNNDTWQIYEDLIVKNCQQHQNTIARLSQCDKETILQRRCKRICERLNLSDSHIKSTILRIWGRFEAFLNFDLVDRKYFLEADFRVMHFADYNTRKRAVLFTILTDYVIAIFSIIVFMSIYIVGMVIITVNVYKNDHMVMGRVLSLEFILLAIDGTAGYTLLIKLYQNGSYIFFIAGASSLISSDCLNTCKRFLKKAESIQCGKAREKNCNKRQQNKQSRNRFGRLVRIFLENHVQICRIQIMNNTNNFNRITFATFTLAFLSHCYCLSQLFLSNRIGSLQRALLVVLLTVQTCIMFFSIIPLAHVHTRYHMFKKMLPKILMNLKIVTNFNRNKTEQHCRPLMEGLFALKWKLLQLYERITHGPKYGTRITFLGTVSYSLLFEIVFLYGAYFMTFVNTVISNKWK